MDRHQLSPVRCEGLEERMLMSAAPVAAEFRTYAAGGSTYSSHPNRQALAGWTLTGYITGTWKRVVAVWQGKQMASKLVWRANGTYLMYLNYRTNAMNVPRQTAWYLVDRGTWKGYTGRIIAGGNGVIHATSRLMSPGRTTVVYVTAASWKLAHVGMRPVNSGKTVWSYWGRIV